MTHLGNFLSDCTAVRRSAGGTRETSYYTAINNLLDNVGAQLKPKVRCVMQLKNLVSPPVTPTPWCKHKKKRLRKGRRRAGDAISGGVNNRNFIGKPAEFQPGTD